MDAAPPPELEEDRAEAGAPEPGGDGGAPRAATPEAPGEADAPAAGGEGEDAPAGPVYKDDLEDSADDDDECAAPDVDAADGEFVPPSSIRKRGRRGERRRSPPRVPCDDPDADFKEITFAVRDVNAHLVCRLCDGYYRDAHTITECLHTFCKGCLLRHLETAPAPVCPHCNAGLGPHPMQGILHDRTMQSLVDKIFPELSQRDRRDRAARKKLRLADAGAAAAPPPPPAAAAPRAPPPPPAADVVDAEVSFKVVPDARLADGEAAPMGALDKPYLKTSGKLKVSQLRKYLSKKLKENADDLELLCAGEGLAAEHSLHFIKRTLWPQPGVELVIHYRVNKALKY